MTTISLHRNSSVDVRPRDAPVGARPALMAAIAAVPPITVLHLGATGDMDPAGWTISDYVVSAPDGIALYAMTAGALAVGGVALAATLRGRRGTAPVRMLLAVWAAAVLMTAVFPTNVRGTPENLSSTIHLIAGAVVFAVLPLVGWMLSRVPVTGRTRRPNWLGRASLIGGVLSTALILNRLPGIIGMPQLMLPPGILQRTAGAALILVLGLAALTAPQTGDRAGDGRSAGPTVGLTLRGLDGR